MTHQPSGSDPAAPAELATLLTAPSEPAREEAWAAFVRAWTPTILRAARSLGGDTDRVMDRYAFVLTRLREEDCRRLRGHARTGADFPLWLTVVVRRLCLDHYRERYGRVRSSAVESAQARAARRRLVDLVAERTDPELLASSGGLAPDAEVVRAERLRALSTALSGLSPADRLLLRLRFAEEATAREIAGLMRFPTVFHVYRRLDHVLKRLRGALDALGIEPEA